MNRIGRHLIYHKRGNGTNKNGSFLMSEVTIRMRANGPLVVEGPVTIVDSQGKHFPIPTEKPAIALCRCGQSQKKPFCDGSHKGCEFVSDELAPS